MDLNNSTTANNLSDAFAGESMANRKYLFFADVARQLGFSDLAKLFKETAAQETEHAFAHFRLMHPELVVDDLTTLSDADKKKIVGRCLELAIEGETYEYTTMYPEFAAAAQRDRDQAAVDEFEAQAAESKEHADIFRTAAHNFGLLTTIEAHHARRYTAALQGLTGEQANPPTSPEATSPDPTTQDPTTQKWICRQCAMIYDPVLGDPDSGIAPGTAFADIPEDWHCPLCGAQKKSFVPYQEPAVA